ncbi:MAG TPA: C40 family peptidase [Pyrinomonadaceae bacterium]|nr:C40 family peptidase [Pyrinomonadaceae bacterium]
MNLRKLVSRILVTLVALGLLSISALSQTRPRVLHQISDEDGVSSSSEGFALVVNVRETKPVWEAKPKPTIDLSTATGPINSAFLKYEPLLLTAIEERLGTPYRWGATGPDRFDCSGFVWSIFQEAGINFERASARTLFARFAAPPEGEQFQFGTLVFFSGLAHVGVVADANGFYHASRHHGVIYSKFDDYWTQRIDGFRRVPLTIPATAQLTSSSRSEK